MMQWTFNLLYTGSIGIILTILAKICDLYMYQARLELDLLAKDFLSLFSLLSIKGNLKSNSELEKKFQGMVLIINSQFPHIRNDYSSSTITQINFVFTFS